MKKRLFFACIYICVSLLLAESTFAEAYTHWQLPEGVFARLGKGSVTDFDSSADGSHLAVASSIGVWIYETTTYREVALITEHAAHLDFIKFSPDGKTIAGADLYLSSGNGRFIHLWDAETGKHKHTLNHTLVVVNMVFSPDSTSLATGCSDSNVYLWDVQTGRHTRTLTGHTDSVVSVAFSPDGKTLASQSGDRTLRFWDAETGRHKHTVKDTHDILDFVFSPDGKNIATATGRAGVTVCLWDVSTGEHTQTLDAYKGVDTSRYGSSLAFSPDGKTLVMSGYGRTLRFWDAETGRLTQTLEEHTDAVARVAFSPDGKTLLCYGWKTLTLWDAKTATLKHVLEHTGRIHGVAFSSDGKTLTTQAISDVSLRLWDVSTGEHIRTLFLDRDADPSLFRSVAFSPDGKVLATASWSDNRNALHFWDVKTGKRTHTFTGHTSLVYSVAFSLDGKLLATASHDGTVLLWDVPRTLVIYEHSEK